MFDASKAKLANSKDKFEAEYKTRSSKARQLGESYLAELDEFLRAYQDSSASDAKLTRLDTTGTLHRAADDAEWAMREQRRIRTALADLA